MFIFPINKHTKIHTNTECSEGQEDKKMVVMEDIKK